MVETECSVYLKNRNEVSDSSSVAATSVFNLKENKKSQRYIIIRLVKILLMDGKASHVLSNTQQMSLSKIMFTTSKFVLSGDRCIVLASYWTLTPQKTNFGGSDNVQLVVLMLRETKTDSSHMSTVVSKNKF